MLTRSKFNTLMNGLEENVGSLFNEISQLNESLNERQEHIDALLATRTKQDKKIAQLEKMLKKVLKAQLKTPLARSGYCPHCGTPLTPDRLCPLKSCLRSQIQKVFHVDKLVRPVIELPLPQSLVEKDPQGTTFPYVIP